MRTPVGDPSHTLYVGLFSEGLLGPSKLSLVSFFGSLREITRQTIGESLERDMGPRFVSCTGALHPLSTSTTTFVTTVKSFTEVLVRPAPLLVSLSSVIT